jgi:hypothetical protein
LSLQTHIDLEELTFKNKKGVFIAFIAVVSLQLNPGGLFSIPTIPSPF